jgi:hypothetical protein
MTRKIKQYKQATMFQKDAALSRYVPIWFRWSFDRMDVKPITV